MHKVGSDDIYCLLEVVIARWGLENIPTLARGKQLTLSARDNGRLYESQQALLRTWHPHRKENIEVGTSESAAILQ